MCLAALPSTDRKQSSMLIVAVRTAQRCDPKIADGERMGVYRQPGAAALPGSAAAAAYVSLWHEIEKRLPV